MRAKPLQSLDLILSLSKGEPGSRHREAAFAAAAIHSGIDGATLDRFAKLAMTVHSA